MAKESESPIFFTPTSYTEATKSSVTSGQILVHMSMRGMTVPKVEAMFRKGAGLQMEQHIRKISGVSRHYKRTSADIALWGIVERERVYTFTLANHIGGTVSVMLTPEQSIAAALAEGRTPEEIVAMVMKIAATQNGTANSVEPETAALEELEAFEEVEEVEEVEK